MSVFLPKVATLQQAIDWMNDATGQQWTLARLIEETAIMPWVWLDYSPDAPPEIFRGRLEGYLAPMLFNGDTLRLAAGADDVVITMTETADGQLVQMVGMRCQLSELRFKREDLEENARILSRPAEPLPAASSGAPDSDAQQPALSISPSKVARGLPKAEILAVDWPMPNGAPPLENALDKIPQWAGSACIKVGRPGKGSHLWNPAALAVCLASRTPHKQWVCQQAALTNLIRASFSDYIDEWNEKKEML